MTLLAGLLAIGVWLLWSWHQITLDWRERRDAVLVDLEVREHGLASAMRRRWRVL